MIRTAGVRPVDGHDAQIKGWGAKDASRSTVIAVSVFVIIVLIIAGFVFLYFLNTQPQPVPKVTTFNGKGVNSTLVVEAPQSISVQPLKAPSQLNITVIVIPLRGLNITAVYVGGNITQLYTTKQLKEVPSGLATDKWTTVVAVTHSGTAQTIYGLLSILVVYHNMTTPTGLKSTATQTVNVPIKIVMTDFPSYFYLFILAFGVVLSRVAPLVPGFTKGSGQGNRGQGAQGGQSTQGGQSNQTNTTNQSDPANQEGQNNQDNQGGQKSQKNQGGQDSQFSLRELIWIPFSVVISLLIFTAFRQQVTLTTDIATNFALAFGFGYAFDKALSSAPGKS